jgi:hypothetical protein
MPSIDWSEIIAFATLALALATVWLAGEQRRARLSVERTHVRIALRAALAEQLENMRRLHPRDPSRGQPALVALRAAGPTFDRLEGLVTDVALPAELAAYVIWLIGDARARWSNVFGLLDEIAPVDGRPGLVHPGNTGIRDDWQVMLERTQVAGCLVASEMNRLGFGDDAAIVGRVAWSVPMVWPPGMRSTTQLSEGIYLDGPPFPAGPAFVGCGPANRDRLAAAAHQSIAALVASQ